MPGQEFDGVVFAGGGCRCFWQAGFYEEAAKSGRLQPKSVAAASAGAALGCVAIHGYAKKALANFKAKAQGNSSNVYPRHVFSSEAVFPHESLFRSAILETIDSAALQRIQEGPEFIVSLTRAPKDSKYWKSRLAAGISSYLLEGKMTTRIHRQWPSKVGFVVEWARADLSTSIEELADLFLHTSCTPPFTPAFQRGGAPVFDGGLIDNVPVAALPHREHILVLLTRPHASLPNTSRVTYVAPSQPISVEKWDYTDPEGLQAAYDLGCEDGARFAAQAQ